HPREGEAPGPEEQLSVHGSGLIAAATAARSGTDLGDRCRALPVGVDPDWRAQSPLLTNVFRDRVEEQPEGLEPDGPVRGRLVARELRPEAFGAGDEVGLAAADRPANCDGMVAHAHQADVGTDDVGPEPGRLPRWPPREADEPTPTFTVREVESPAL